MFIGLAGMDHEKTVYVKFVDRIENSVDFQKTWDHKFINIIQIPCLGICIFGDIGSGLIFHFVGLNLRVLWDFKNEQKSDQK